MTKQEEFMKEYKEQHSCCPNCHSKNYSTTLCGYIYNPTEEYIDRNSCHCFDCGWRGISHELVPDTEKQCES